MTSTLTYIIKILNNPQKFLVVVLLFVIVINKRNLINRTQFSDTVHLRNKYIIHLHEKIIIYIMLKFTKSRYYFQILRFNNF